jgi:hypothetical protein
MSINVTLVDVQDGFDGTTINANNELLMTALNRGLSRYADSPNAMQSNLDMNGFNLINAGNISAKTAAGKVTVLSSAMSLGLNVNDQIDYLVRTDGGIAVTFSSSFAVAPIVTLNMSQSCCSVGTLCDGSFVTNVTTTGFTLVPCIQVVHSATINQNLIINWCAQPEA